MVTPEELSEALSKWERTSGQSRGFAMALQYVEHEATQAFLGCNDSAAQHLRLVLIRLRSRQKELDDEAERYRRRYLNEEQEAQNG